MSRKTYWLLLLKLEYFEAIAIKNSSKSIRNVIKFQSGCYYFVFHFTLAHLCFEKTRKRRSLRNFIIIAIFHVTDDCESRKKSSFIESYGGADERKRWEIAWEDVIYGCNAIKKHH